MNFQDTIYKREIITDSIHMDYIDFKEQLQKWSKGSNRAGQRARVSSVKLAKKLKEFREVSVRKKSWTTL